MKARIKLAILIAALGIAVFKTPKIVLFASTFDIDNDASDSTSGYGCTFDESSKTLTITDNDWDYPESKRENVQHIIINSTVDRLEVSAFDSDNGWRSLSSATLPDSLTSIGQWAFYRTGITSITFRGNSNNLVIGKSAFYGCPQLKEVIFSGEFNNISIFANAFEDCATLDTIVFPQCKMIIDPTAFTDCSKIDTANFPDNVLLGYTGDGYYFENRIEDDGSQVGVLTITSTEGTRNWINHGDFRKTDITHIIITENVSVIQEYSFSDCPNLEEIDFSACPALEKIGSNAFSNCSRLNKIIFPERFNRLVIIDDAFADTNITASVFPDATIFANVVGEKYFFGYRTEQDGSQTGILTITGEEGLSGWKDDNNIEIETINELVIAEPISSIDDNAFSGCTNLKKVTLPSTLTTIGENSFKECTSLINITLPEGLETIKKRAFFGCTSLKGNMNEFSETIFEIPSSVKVIEARAFEGCVLEKVIFKSKTAPEFHYFPLGCENLGLIVHIPYGSENYDTQINGWYTLCYLPEVQPEEQHISAGEKASFQVALYRNNLEIAAYTFQWQKLDDNGKWTDIPGANDRKYTIDSVSNSSCGTYRCKVTVSFNSDTVNASRKDIMVSNESILTLTNASDTIQENEWIEPLTITGWTYGEPANSPSAIPKYGADTVIYRYCKTADGVYTETVPTAPGNWYVTAEVPATVDYTGLKHDPVAFTIRPKSTKPSTGNNSNHPGVSTPGSTEQTPPGSPPPDSTQDGSTPPESVPVNPPQNNDGPSYTGTNKNIIHQTLTNPDDLSTKKSKSGSEDALQNNNRISSEDNDNDSFPESDKVNQIKNVIKKHPFNSLLVILVLIICISRIVFFLIEKKKIQKDYD